RPGSARAARGAARWRHRARRGGPAGPPPRARRSGRGRYGRRGPPPARSARGAPPGAPADPRGRVRAEPGGHRRRAGEASCRRATDPMYDPGRGGMRVKRWGGAVLGVVLAASLAAAQGPGFRPRTELLILTGSEQGTYYAVARDLERLAEEVAP